MKISSLVLVAMLIGCSGRRQSQSNIVSTPPSSPAPMPPSSPSPAPVPPAPPAPTNAYTITVYSGNNQIGSTYQVLTDPLVAEVRDSNGNLADNIYVRFQADDPNVPVLGCGTTTTGMGLFLVAGPGTGRAAVFAGPYVTGVSKVRCTVQSGGTSNACIFTVIGQ